MAATPRPDATRVPPEGAFIVGAVSQYLGAAIAVNLFDRIAAPGVALLRVGTAGLILVALRRPWRRSWTRAQLGLAAAFGTALAFMNLLIYFAIDELPLGTAVAIEFLGPITVAAFGTRNLRNLLALLLAIAGVAVLSEVQPAGSTTGVLFALGAGAMWAGYIVLGHRVSRRAGAQDGLGVGTMIGALAIAPIGLGEVGPAIDTPWIVLVAALTGVLSNVVPYSIDQVVMQRISQGRFALLQALLPVTAALIGFVALGQTPSGGEFVGIGLVIAALTIRTRDLQPIEHTEVEHTETEAGGAP